MQYEWDEPKRLSNAGKHGIGFRDAVEIFAGDYEQSIYFRGIAD